MSDQQPDRRAHERVEHIIEFEGVHREKKAVVRMVASNLSLGGIYCTSSHDFPEMTRLSVRIPLPGQEDLEVEAVVVRRRELPSSSSGEERFELALFFTNISERQQENLSDFLKSKAMPEF